MGYFDDLLAKEGETIQRYEVNFSARNPPTNRAFVSWKDAVDVSVVVRGVPAVTETRKEGTHFLNQILVLTINMLTVNDVIKWEDSYFTVLNVEKVYLKGTLQYYRCVCQENLTFP
jgi:hypothetical protein